MDEITESEIRLSLTDKDEQATYQLAFGLEYYKPSNGTTSEGDQTLPSGAYIFKPKIDDQISHPYSKFSSYKVQPDDLSDDSVAAAFIFDFEK